MEKLKAILAVILFVASLLFAFNPGKSRSETKKWNSFNQAIDPVEQQDTTYSSPF